MAEKLSTLVTQKIGSPCSHICLKLCESTLLQGHSHSNHHGQDGGGFSAIFQVGREDQFLGITSDELFTVLMIFSCYQYCFSFWFRCFRLSWSPTLFTGGYLTKIDCKSTHSWEKDVYWRNSHIYSWSAWNLVTSSTYRGRPPTWESPSMWKTTSGWQCSGGSFNAFFPQDWVYWQCAEAWETDWGRVHTASEVLHLREPITWSCSLHAVLLP